METVRQSPYRVSAPLCCRYRGSYMSAPLCCRYRGSYMSAPLCCRYRGSYMSAPLCCRYRGSYMSAPLCCRYRGSYMSAPLCCRYRGSYMSAHVLLNFIKRVGKSDKMRGLPSTSSLFRNVFNKFNNTRARMLDSIYHMTEILL